MPHSSTSHRNRRDLLTSIDANNAAFNFAAAMINPVLGVLASLSFIFKRQQPSWIALALSVALIYSYLPLLWDVRNNYFQIYVFRDVDFNLYTGLLDLIINSIGIQYISGVFLFGFFTMYVHGRFIGSHIITGYRDDKLRYFLCFALLFASMEYVAVFGLQKTSLAVAVLIAAICTNNKPASILLSVVSALIHPFVLGIIILFPLAQVLERLSSRVWVGILLSGLIISLFATPERLVDLLSSFSFTPNRLLNYLARDNGRFSSEGITNLVWALRVSACLAVAVCCVLEVSRAQRPNERWLLGVLICLSVLTICLSRNEIIIERYFLAMTAVSALTASRVKFVRHRLQVITLSILINVAIHGVYTLHLIHSNSYEVILTHSERREISLRSLYLPTFLLLDYSDWGYSDDLIEVRSSSR